jgi:alkanesulfonate monooxygenase SsuD/methylene tetrahydromethanopterin reductase-like flavin-dependent oxidoreductase (luciferase family)
MKFGLHYLLSCSESQSPSQRYRDTLEQAVRAEGLGFESVWPVEQHFNQLQSARMYSEVPWWHAGERRDRF